MLGVGVNTRMETTEKVDLNELQKSVQQEAENAIRWQVNTDVRLLFCSIFFYFTQIIMWRPPSLSVLSVMIFNMMLTHLGSETSIYCTAYVFAN